MCYYCSPPVSFFQNYLAEEKTTTKTKQKKRLLSHANAQSPITLALKMSFREIENCLLLKLDHSVIRFLWIVAQATMFNTRERVRQTHEGEVNNPEGLWTM